MNVRAAIVERLMGDAAVLAAGCTGVRPVQGAQDDVLPLIVYERTSGAALQTLDGSTALRADTFALYCFAATDAGAQALADAALASLLNPAWTQSSDGSAQILCVLEADGSDGSEPPLHAMELAPYRVDVSVQITHQ